MTLRDAIDFLAKEATRRGGMAFGSTANVGIPIRVGESLAFVRMGKNGQGELMMPALTLTKDVSFGEYFVGLYIINAKDVEGVP